ncbi:31146_t:CDS:2, partial [Gigaspora margarita]
ISEQNNNCGSIFDNQDSSDKSYSKFDAMFNDQTTNKSDSRFDNQETANESDSMSDDQETISESDLMLDDQKTNNESDLIFDSQETTSESNSTSDNEYVSIFDEQEIMENIDSFNQTFEGNVLDNYEETIDEV